MTSSQTSSEDK